MILTKNKIAKFSNDKKLDSLVKYIIWYQKDVNQKRILNLKEVAALKIDKKIEYSNDLTNLKLQKVLYFLYGYYHGFAVHNKWNTKELFDANFEAWIYGPVIREIYDNYKIIKNIIDENDANKNGVSEELIKKHKEFENKLSSTEIIKIRKILDYLFDFSAWLLVDLSHMTLPWKQTIENKDYNGNKISSKIIGEYFEKIYEHYKEKF